MGQIWLLPSAPAEDVTGLGNPATEQREIAGCYQQGNGFFSTGSGRWLSRSDGAWLCRREELLPAPAGPGCRGTAAGNCLFSRGCEVRCETGLDAAINPSRGTGAGRLYQLGVRLGRGCPGVTASPHLRYNGRKNKTMALGQDKTQRTTHGLHQSGSLTGHSMHACNARRLSRNCRRP